MKLSDYDKKILAQTLLGEAGGEGYEGMLAVAHVIKNRVKSPRFPDNPVSVALQPKQFSTWNKGAGGNNPQRYNPNSRGWNTALSAIEDAFGGAPDPTGGATHYWAPRGMPGGRDPYWAKSEERAGRIRIKNHVFLPKSTPDRVTARRDVRQNNNPVNNVYIVRRGDSLSKIAQRYYGDMRRYKEIARLNKIKNPDLIRTGQKIVLPDNSNTDDRRGTRVRTIRRGETLSSIAKRVYGDASKYKELARLNNIKDPNKIYAGAKLRY